MSLKSGTLPPKGGAFEKKPRNHGVKYAHVGSLTDTGHSASKGKKVNSDRIIAKRRDELFKRVQIHTLAQRIREAQWSNPESVYALAEQTIFPSVSRAEQGVHSVINSEQDVKGPDSLMILDIRPAEDFEKCHLQTAKSYPVQLLNHDKISPELYTFKSAATGSSNKRVVIYDIDDKLTAKTTAMLVEKGWENVYALSGGFEEICESYPELLDGEVPISLHEKMSTASRNTPMSSGGAARSAASTRPGSSCSRTSNVSGMSRFTQMSTRR